jgi:hypothetical protein
VRRAVLPPLAIADENLVERLPGAFHGHTVTLPLVGPARG